MVSPSEQVGRNDPCPCGSGKKNKRCHNVRYRSDLLPKAGSQRSPSPFDGKPVVVRNPKTGQVYAFADPGIELSGLVTTQGDIDALDGDPTSLVSVIRYDVPAYLPLQPDTSLRVPAPTGADEPWLLQFVQLPVAEATFGLSTPHLQRFTRLEVVVGRVVRAEGHRAPGEAETILRAALQFLAGPLASAIGTRIPDVSGTPSLPFIVDYYRASDDPKTAVPVTRVEVPFTGSIYVPDKDEESPITDETIAALNSIRAELLTKALTRKAAHQGLSFAASLGQLLHDFAFYARQHAGSLAPLSEEDIRDLCLIPAKVIFTSAEGEATHFSGKTDMKVTSPHNRYEIAVIEFKRWRGLASLEAVFKQLTREHATGQEAMLALILLSANKDSDAVLAQSVAWLQSQPETALDASVRPYSGIERFHWGTTALRGRRVPLLFGLADLYYENPRARAAEGPLA